MVFNFEAWVTSESKIRSAGSDNFGRARDRNSKLPDRLYISMAERMEQRKQRRQELEMRYECARKQQEVFQTLHIDLNVVLTMSAFRSLLSTVSCRMGEASKLGHCVLTYKESLGNLLVGSLSATKP